MYIAVVGFCASAAGLSSQPNQINLLFFCLDLPRTWQAFRRMLQPTLQSGLYFLLVGVVKTRNSPSVELKATY